MKWYWILLCIHLLQNTFGAKDRTYQFYTPKIYSTRPPSTTGKPVKAFDPFAHPVNWTYRELPRYKTFIDRSLMIRDFFGTFPVGSLVLFQSPRGFAKTANLEMLRAFVQLEMDKFGERPNKTELTHYYLFGRKLKISKYKNLIAEHMGEYPVIHLDLNHVIGDTQEATLTALRRAIRFSFQQYEWLRRRLKSNHTADGDKMTPTQKYDFYLMEKILDGEPTRVEVPESFYVLARILHRYFGKKVFVFVDCYDSPIIDTIPARNLDMKEVYYLILTDFLGQIFKEEYMSYHVAYGFITGITRMAIVDRINVQVQGFLDNHMFVQYYGFTEKEVIELLHRYGKDASELNEIKRLYSNYTATIEGQTVQLYNNYAIVNYLKGRNRNDTEVMDYWANDVVLQDLHNFLPSNEFRRSLTKLLFDGRGEVVNTFPLSTYEIWCINQVNHLNYINLTRYEIGVLYKYLAECGYTVNSLDELHPTVSIAVEEIKPILLKQLEKFYTQAGLDLPSIGENLIGMLYSPEISEQRITTWNTTLNDWMKKWNASWNYEYHSYYRKYDNSSRLDKDSVFEVQAIMYCSFLFWFQDHDIGGSINIVPTAHNRSAADLVAISGDQSSVMIIRTIFKKPTFKAIEQAKKHKLLEPKAPKFVKYMAINVTDRYYADVAMALPSP